MPAAAPPSRSWRSPPYHQARLVTLVTIAPQPNSASSDTTMVGTDEPAPSTSGRSGIRAPTVKAPNDDMAATIQGFRETVRAARPGSGAGVGK